MQGCDRGRRWQEHESWQQASACGSQWGRKRTLLLPWRASGQTSFCHSSKNDVTIYSQRHNLSLSNSSWLRVSYCWCSSQQPNFWELTQSTISSQSTFLIILIKEHSFPFRAISTRPDMGCSLHTEISSSAGTCSGRTMLFKVPS